MRATAPAESSTPQSESVWKVRLSRATTDAGGVAISFVPVLSSIVTVAAAGSVFSVSSEPPEVHPARARRPTRAALVAVRVLGTDMERLLFCGIGAHTMGAGATHGDHPRRLI